MFEELFLAGKLQAIASAVDGFDEPRLAGIGLELGAEMTHVHTDGFDVIVGLITPHLFEDQRGGHRLPMALEQAMKQLKLQVGQANGLVEPDGLKALRHQGETGVAENFVVLGGERCPLAASQQGLDPHHQLFEVEGLGQIVIGTGVESTDFVFGATQSRDHQDGNSRCALISPQPLTKGEAIHFGQHQIKQDDIRAVLQRERLPLDSILSPLHVETAMLQMARDQIPHVAVILDKKNAGFHQE